MVERFDIYWVQLDPTRGREIRKTRPCVIVSPDELNTKLGTVIIAPVTSSLKKITFRVQCTIKNKIASIFLDQIRTVDNSRLVQKIGQLPPKASPDALDPLKKMVTF